MIGKHPKSNAKILAGISRYGSYIVHDDPENGKDYRSIPKDKSVINITLKQAVEILSVEKRTRKKAAEPVREIGIHPENNQPINIFKGPYGPYIKYQKVNVAIPKESNIEEISLEQALDMISIKMASQTKGRGRRRKK